MERTHVDLFTGLAGFSLAASWNGVRTIAMCEKDERRRAFLAKAWPGVPCHDDIRTFDAENCRGVWLLTAGVPCQPVSCAGKRRGAADDRWLWPQVIRVLSEVRPTWALFENPTGIESMGLDGVLADVEGAGYEVGPIFDIPACAVNAPHRRARLWIVANATRDGAERNGSTAASAEYAASGATAGSIGRVDCEFDGKIAGVLADAGRLASGQDEPERGQDSRTADRGAGARCLADSGQGAIREAAAGWAGRAQGTPIAGTGSSELAHATRPPQQGPDAEPATHGCGSEYRSPWGRFVWLPCADGKVRRAPDDAFGLVDGVHRSLLSALGDSIIPQVAAQVIAAMIGAEERT